MFGLTRSHNRNPCGVLDRVGESLWDKSSKQSMNKLILGFLLRYLCLKYGILIFEHEPETSLKQGKKWVCDERWFCSFTVGYIKDAHTMTT